MSLFDKWSWIKRNWTYILEEASKLDLVFVGGTALNQRRPSCIPDNRTS